MTNHITLPRSDLEPALADALKNERHRNVAETRYWLDQYKLIAKQAIAALAAPQGEPVAWLYTAHDGGVQAFTLEPPPRLKKLCKPLYTTPQPAPQGEAVKFLANGTRFKMAFFDSEDGCGNVGTYVTCFEGFNKELDGRWVALVAAEDDSHLKLTTPQPAPTLEPPEGWKMVQVDALTRWRDAFAEELAGLDIDPPLHHVKTSHDEISALLDAAKLKGGA